MKLGYMERTTIRAHVDTYPLGHTTTARITLNDRVWLVERAGVHISPLGDIVRNEIVQALGLANVLTSKTTDLGNGCIEFTVTQL